MRRFFWMIIILLISVWAGVKISQDPGYALFVYRDSSVEMPLWFAFLSLMILMMGLYFILRFFDGLEGLLFRLKNWFRTHQKYKSVNKTNRGLVELLEGDWRHAEYYLMQGVDRADTVLVNYLGAAKAAHEQMAYDRRDGYLQKIRTLVPEAIDAIQLTEVQWQISQGELESALKTLLPLRQRLPSHPLVLQLLERLYIRMKEWDALLALLPDLRRSKLMTSQQLENFEAHLYQEMLNQISTSDYSWSLLQEAWARIPVKFKKNPEVIATYIKKILPTSAAHGEIEALIVNTLKKNWQEALCKWYGQIEHKDPKRSLDIAEGWLKQYGYRSALFMTLGRLCLKAQLWGKARSYIEQSIKADPTPEAYYLYGRLLEQLGEPEAAKSTFETGLSLMGSVDN